MGKYYVTERRPEDAHMKNATGKARADVERTLAGEGFIAVKIDLAFGGENTSLKASLKEHWETYGIWKDRLSFLGRGDTLVIQFPTISHCIYLSLLSTELRAKGVKVVFLIHDLEKLRFILEKDAPKKTQIRRALDESVVLKTASKIIAHNDTMVNYLKEEGIPSKKLISMGLFDYLLPDDFSSLNHDLSAEVIIAGNLDSEKVGYLADIGKVPGVTFELYGVGYKNNADNAVYNGSFLPDELPAALRGSFGLVWDGTSIETCDGNYGNYLRYNDPHKCSLYLASGFPVIVWDQSALAQYITSNRLGLAVSSLRDIETAVSRLGAADYADMCENVNRVGAQLREGYFLRNALEKI